MKGAFRCISHSLRFADCRESLTWRTLSEQVRLVGTCLSDNQSSSAFSRALHCHFGEPSAVPFHFSCVVQRAIFALHILLQSAVAGALYQLSRIPSWNNIIPSLYNSLAALIRHDCPYPSRCVSYFSTLRPHHRFNVVVGFLCCRICSFHCYGSPCVQIVFLQPPLSARSITKLNMLLCSLFIRVCSPVESAGAVFMILHFRI